MKATIHIADHEKAEAIEAWKDWLTPALAERIENASGPCTLEIDYTTNNVRVHVNHLVPR